MQTHIYDQFEFESASSEETLHIVIARKDESSAQSFFDSSRHERFRYGIYDSEKTEYKNRPELKRDRRRKRRELARAPKLDLQPLQMADYPNAKQLRQHAERFGCFPEPIEKLTIIALLHHSPPFVPFKTELLLESEKHFVWYNWCSTA